MRTSNCQENNEEVNKNPQSEFNVDHQSEQQENIPETINNNNTSSNSIVSISSIEAESTSDKLSSDSATEKNQLCEGFICYCAKNKSSCCVNGLSEIPSSNNGPLNSNTLFDILKEAEPIRPVNIKPVEETTNDSDSDIEIIEDTDQFPKPIVRSAQDKTEIPPIKTYQSVKSANLGLKRPLSAQPASSSSSSRPKRFRVAKENRDYCESESAKPEVKVTTRKRGLSAPQSTRESKNIRLEDSKSDSTPIPSSSTSVADQPSSKFEKRKPNLRILNHNKELQDDMSMYDYRFADPQLPSSTSYFAPSTKSPAIVAEEQQNSSNATTQNILDSNKTIATLCNIGNSCYLNSVVYTLRFAPLFLHKLHHLIEDMATIYIKLNPTKHKSSSLGRNVSLWQGHSGRSWSSKDLASLGSITGNDSVPRNNRLIVTEKLHELYTNLHKNESTLNTEPFHAGTFLQAIQEVCSIFEGNQQQDAHECLMCILDSIRETCNTLATAIIENPEQLLAEYGLGSLIEESRSDEVLQQQSMHQQLQQVSSGGSSSSKGLKGLLSRKSKRKKSDDENPVATNSTSPTEKSSIPESPCKNRDDPGNGPTQSSEIMCEENGDTISSNATSPTSTIDTKLNMKNAILKALAGDNDVNDKQKMKENVCKLFGLNFFCEDFEGVTVSSIKCLTCEHVKTLKEKMIDISVPITGHENPESMNNPQSFFQNSCITKEYFRGENKYRCENCFGYTEAIRSINYEILPRLLVIHLKRFSGGMEKINSYIPTPFTLKCFCNSCINLPDEEKLHIYKLYSVITHVGATMSVGHYVAYTCALDIQNEYRICTNDRTKIVSLFQKENSTCDTNASSQSGSNPSLATSNGGSDKNQTGKSLKRFFFGPKKASSSNDLKSNSFKSNVNGLVNKVVTNGIEKLNLGINNTTGRVLGNSNGTSTNICQGQKCCGIKESKLVSNNNGSFISYVNGGGAGTHLNGSINGSHPEMDTLIPPTATKPSSSDLSIASSNSSANNQMDDDATVTSTTTTSNIGKSSNNYFSSVNNITQDHWYMCDDDKIKVMQQQQFEEHLSPTRKNMITPYLLFYARFDAHPQL
uniref:CSON014339 protein n=1 Tax=Culicoides sonorensis TaxID=179676 RepID=A0A336MD53_CULSO